ncbi:sulfatase family protein [Mucilaginibacter myungsuensis]|uniref:Sulfatase n=1 Tax=Mucilaginibacter myungsuensis TaxID=649104 RepID=A0A929KXG5_9SPHI|nr:sulfatase [Mucilaginibacter myungsuensis]MBE9660435.1 sulfatase [Mucilaginibacter myungsuensis]MDN3600477.1 sulfatase [Mucilaginibacter myungsuensis]
MKYSLLYLLLVASVSSVFAQAKKTTAKPNIVLIMADDLTMRDIEPYGSKQVHTPNLAKLASEGVCMDNMYNMVPVCSPTRQSLLTGLGPVRSGAYPNHTMIYKGIKTLPVYLQQLGYNTALIGKRHYAPEEAYPLEHIGGRDHDGGEGKDVDLSIAEKYIAGKKSSDKPFFLMFTSNQPHEPWNRGDQSAYDPDKIKLAPNMLDAKNTRKQMAKYFAEVTYLDSLVGECLNIIERSGQKDNTIVLFLTEQGNSFPFSKWTLYDQGLHSGFIVRWPGVVKPGTRNPAMMEYIDVLPTLIDIAGGDPTKINTGSKDGNGNMGFDGLSIKKILKGEDTHLRDYVFAEQTTRGIIAGSDAYAVRSARNSKYLYIRNLNYKGKFKNTVTNSIMFKQWMATDSVRASFYQTRPEEELYDIENDPFNLKNIASDPKYASAKADLRSKLDAFMKQQNDKGIATEMEALTRQPKNGDNN